MASGAEEIIRKVASDLRDKLDLRSYSLEITYFRGPILLGVFVPPDSKHGPHIDINGDFDLLLLISPADAEAYLVYMVSHEMRHFWQWTMGWDILSDEAEDDADEFAGEYVENWFERKGELFDSRDILYIGAELDRLLRGAEVAYTMTRIVFAAEADHEKS